MAMKMLFPDRLSRSPTAVRDTVPLGVFRLMRSVFETPDRVSQAIGVFVSERARGTEAAKVSPVSPLGSPKLLFPDSRFRSPTIVDLGTFFMEFWNMKQREELSPEEPAATWAVLMRGIDVRNAVRILLEQHLHTSTGQLHHKVVGLTVFVRGWLSALGDPLTPLTPPVVSKIRTGLVEHLRAVAAIREISVLDPIDAGLFLSACETALVVEAEEKKRWATTHR